MGFKIGDKVVCNRGSNSLRMGQEYVVRALDEDMDVALDNVMGFWSQDRFTLVPRQQDETTARMVRKCDNCGRTGTRCTRRVIDGVTVWDCLKCWPPAIQVDREIQKVWLEGTMPVIQSPVIRCACCSRPAPRKVVKGHVAPGNLLGLKVIEQNDLTGWMLVVMPYADPYMKPRNEGIVNARFGMPFSEVTKVCPKCAPTILGTIDHLKHPPLSEEDL